MRATKKLVLTGLLLWSTGAATLTATALPGGAASGTHAPVVRADSHWGQPPGSR